MPEPAPGAPKAEWREWARQTRAALRPQPVEEAALVGALRGLLLEKGARRVLAYRALPGEPDVSALAGEFELLTPRARFRPQRRLTLHPWASATERSPFGVLQPPADAPERPLHEVDAVLLPGLAFDRAGLRLGYGGGFYDRLLPGFGGLVIGVVWSPLWVARLPGDPHDCRAGWVATERGVEGCGEQEG